MKNKHPNTAPKFDPGTLELYVTNSLSKEETVEVNRIVSAHEDLKNEVDEIENTLINLAETTAPKLSAVAWMQILKRVQPTKKQAVIRLYAGWLTAAALVVGGLFLFTTNLRLQTQVNTINNDLIVTQSQLDFSEDKIQTQEQLLDILRSKDYQTILLGGNPDVAATAFAKVYYNAQTNTAYIDAQGLPDAPENHEFQVWNITSLQPLTPESMGLINTTAEVSSKVYKFENVTDPAAFGITLEPAGGSQAPTLERLYTIGVIAP